MPTFGLDKKNNVFGLGVSSLRNGFSNEYTLDTEYLKVLNLNSSEYTILNWKSQDCKNSLGFNLFMNLLTRLQSCNEVYSVMTGVSFV